MGGQLWTAKDAHDTPPRKTIGAPQSSRKSLAQRPKWSQVPRPPSKHLREQTPVPGSEVPRPCKGRGKAFEPAPLTQTNKGRGVLPADIWAMGNLPKLPQSKVNPHARQGRSRKRSIGSSRRVIS